MFVLSTTHWISMHPHSATSSPGQLNSCQEKSFVLNLNEFALCILAWIHTHLQSSPVVRLVRSSSSFSCIKTMQTSYKQTALVIKAGWLNVFSSSWQFIRKRCWSGPRESCCTNCSGEKKVPQVCVSSTCQLLNLSCKVTPWNVPMMKQKYKVYIIHRGDSMEWWCEFLWNSMLVVSSAPGAGKSNSMSDKCVGGRGGYILHFPPRDRSRYSNTGININQLKLWIKDEVVDVRFRIQFYRTMCGIGRLQHVITFTLRDG